jgi:small subunit ribosomal protein S8
MTTTNYPLGDFLIRLKNASRARHKEVGLPTSKLIVAVAEVLKRQGFLTAVETKDGITTVTLAYKAKRPMLMDLKLVSKLGLRIYENADTIKKHRGASILILSSSKGILSSKEAIKEGVGGEVIAEVW